MSPNYEVGEFDTPSLETFLNSVRGMLPLDKRYHVHLHFLNL